MLSVTFHGRGGQGAVTAAELLAIAAFKDGKFCQSFPVFGTERAGAPVRAFVRIDDKFIRLREPVSKPNYVMVLDPTLISAVDVTEGMESSGILIVNTSQEKKKIKTKKKVDIRTHDITTIALDIMGKPFVNTAMLGAFVAVTHAVSLESIIEAVNERFPEKVAKMNVETIKKVYEEFKK